MVSHTSPESETLALVGLLYQRSAPKLWASSICLSQDPLKTRYVLYYQDATDLLDLCPSIGGEGKEQGTERNSSQMNHIYTSSFLNIQQRRLEYMSVTCIGQSQKAYREGKYDTKIMEAKTQCVGHKRANKHQSLQRFQCLIILPLRAMREGNLDDSK